MTDKIILCVDMQRYYEPQFNGSYDSACENANSFIVKAAQHNIPTWFTYMGASKLKDVFLNADSPIEHRRQILTTFDESRFGGIRDLVRAPDAPVFFKSYLSVCTNQHFLPALERHGVKKIYAFSYGLPSCVAACAVDIARYGFEVSIVENLAFPGSPAGSDREAEIRICLTWALSQTIRNSLGSFKRPGSEAVDEFLNKNSNPGWTVEEMEVFRLHNQNFEASRILHRFRAQEIIVNLRLSNDPVYLALQAIKIVDSADILEGRVLPPNTPLLARPIAANGAVVV